MQRPFNSQNRFSYQVNKTGGFSFYTKPQVQKKDLVGNIGPVEKDIPKIEVQEKLESSRALIHSNRELKETEVEAK